MSNAEYHSLIADANIGQCDGWTESPGKSQKEEKEDQEEVKRLRGLSSHTLPTPLMLCAMHCLPHALPIP